MLYPNGLFVKPTVMVKDLKYNFYVSYEKEISLMPSYSDALAVGSKNYKKSAVEDHAKSKPHMKAYQLYLCSQRVSLEKSAKFFSSNLGNESIVSGFLQKDPKDLAVMKRKFELAYFVAKNELPFNKYKDILSLDKHFVQMGDFYINDTACANFNRFCWLRLKRSTEQRLGKS